MEDLLKEYRNEFKRNFSIQTDKNALYSLIDNQNKIERLYRRGILLNEIKNLGLEEYSEEIIDGMNNVSYNINKASKGITIPTERFSNYLLSSFDEALIRGLNYIKKWKMYNELFQNK